MTTKARSFGAMLGKLAADAPDALAVVSELADGVQTLTRSQLDRGSNQLARAYAASGLGEGDTASLTLANSTEFFLSCFAIWKLGAVPNPLSPALPVRERDTILSRAQPALVIGVDTDECAFPCFAPDTDVHAFPDEPLPDILSPFERALGSGGSTGLPKLIVAANPPLYDAQNASPLFRGKQAVLVPGPLYHGAPFSAAFQGLFGGCQVVVMHRFDAERCLQLIERYQVDRMTVVPTMMQRIWKLPRPVRERYDVSSLEFVLTGSAPCPQWLMRAWIDWLGPDVMHEAFGPSERIGGTFISGREWLTHPGSVGRPAAGARLKILDDAGNELPPGEMGEIYVMPAAGPGSTFHYVGAKPRLSAEGWQSVGDMGYFDEDGYLFLGDRRSDMILVAGRNVYPAEVEAAIDAFEGVRSCAVIGLAHEDLGQCIHAIIDIGDNAGRFSEDALRVHLRAHLVHYKQPTSIELVRELLRDDAGKVRRTALRAEREPSHALTRVD